MRQIARVAQKQMGRSEQEDDKPFDVRLSDESFETHELDPPPYTLQTTKKELRQMLEATK